MTDEHGPTIHACTFERRATSVWRSVRRFLPERVAEAIRIPAKRALRAVGVIREV
jgi:hypothetical protein